MHALEATNFFLADVQTGLGPFLAAYLAGAGWGPGRVGMALTIGGIITVVLQAPAGAIVDELSSKRLILVIACAVLAAGALLLSLTAAPWAVYSSQVLIGGAGPFLGPTLAAVTMGVVGVTFFDRQFGKNQSFNSAGNVFCALLIAGVSHLFGNRAIFITAAVLTVPTVLAVLAMCLAALVITAVVSIKSRSNPLKLAREVSWGTLLLVAGLFVMVDAVESQGAKSHAAVARVGFGLGSECRRNGCGICRGYREQYRE